MKYKAGDQVRIKSLDWYNKNIKNNGIIICGSESFTHPMSHFCDKVVTIVTIQDDCYRILEDDGDWYWTDEMIECKVEEEASTKPEKVSTHSTFVETARGYLVEAIADLNAIDVSHMSDLEKSSLYCAKENIKDALNLLEE